MLLKSKIMKTNNITPATEMSRDEKMNQLLDQMTELFLKAFPEAPGLAIWLAEANDLIWMDKGANYANDAALFTYHIGTYILPGMIIAKSNDEIVQRVKDGLADMGESIGHEAGGYAISFIVHRLNLRVIENKYDPEDYIKIVEFNSILDSLGSVTFEYGRLYEDESKERAKKYKAEDAVERVDRVMGELLASLSQ